MTPITKFYQQAWTRWLDAVDSGFDLFLKSPAFVLGMGKLSEGSSRLQAKRAQVAERVLAESRVASKDDVDRLAADAHRLEGKLNELLLRHDEQPAPEAADAAPVVDLAAVEQRLEALVARLERLETAKKPAPRGKAASARAKKS